MPTCDNNFAKTRITIMSPKSLFAVLIILQLGMDGSSWEVNNEMHTDIRNASRKNNHSLKRCCTNEKMTSQNKPNITELAIPACSKGANSNPRDSTFEAYASHDGNSSVSVSVKWVEQLPKCAEYAVRSEFRVLQDGRIIAQISESSNQTELWIDVTNTSHCFRCSDQGEACDSVLLCNEFLQNEMKQIKVLHQKFVEDVLSAGGKTSGWLALFSALILALTILIYALLWRDQNVHGWTQVSFLLALFCMYLSAGLRRRVGLSQLQRRPTLAMALEVLEDFGGVATSANLVALSFDLLYTLWRALPTYNRSSGRTRFITTTILAWSTGLIFVIWSLSYHKREVLYNSDDPLDLGKHRKYMSKLLESFLCIQMFGMVPSWWLSVLQLTLLFLNLIVFISSLVILYRKQKSLAFATENVKRQKLLKTWTRRFTKLFLLMGLWWPMSVICLAQCFSVFSHTIAVWKETLTTYYMKSSRVNFQIQWHVHLTANYLAGQAIIVCILFVWNRKILQALRKRYPRINSLTSE